MLCQINYYHTIPLLAYTQDAVICRNYKLPYNIFTDQSRIYRFIENKVIVKVITILRTRHVPIFAM